MPNGTEGDGTDTQTSGGLSSTCAFRTSAEQNKRGPAALSKFRALPQFFVHTGGQDGKYPSALILFSTNLHV